MNRRAANLQVPCPAPVLRLSRRARYKCIACQPNFNGAGHSGLIDEREIDVTDTSRDSLLNIVIQVLEDTIRDWDMEQDGGMSEQTRILDDLGFESIDVVQFAVALETAVGRKGLPFEKLFIEDGAYVDDVSVAEIVTFLQAELATL